MLPFISHARQSEQIAHARDDDWRLLRARVSTTRYRDRERSVAREGRDCERQTFCRKRANNEVPSLAQMSGGKTRDATDVIRSRICALDVQWEKAIVRRKSQVVTTSQQQMLFISVLARPLARSFRGLVFNLRRAATLARSSTIRPHRVAGSPLGRLPC